MRRKLNISCYTAVPKTRLLLPAAVLNSTYEYRAVRRSAQLSRVCLAGWHEWYWYPSQLLHVLQYTYREVSQRSTAPHNCIVIGMNVMSAEEADERGGARSCGGIWSSVHLRYQELLRSSLFATRNSVLWCRFEDARGRCSPRLSGHRTWHLRRNCNAPRTAETAPATAARLGATSTRSRPHARRRGLRV